MYILKNGLYQQSFLYRDSFLNRAFLNRDSTVPKGVDKTHLEASRTFVMEF